MTSSPLSSISSLSDSFHTADGSPKSPMQLEVEAQDDSAIDVSNDHVNNVGDEAEGDEVKRYRAAKDLPYELRHHILVYLEEQLYSNALTLLTNLVAQGTSYPLPAGPTYVPPPTYLSLASTLLCHPLHTTRAEGPERKLVSSHAYTYLRTLLSLVGPINSDLTTAFTFQHHSNLNNIRHRKAASSSRRKRSRGGASTRDNSSDSGDEDSRSDDLDSEDEIHSPLAKEGNIFHRADDFWHVVGWAMNCSVRHRKRWDIWRIWLSYMLDVLDEDWKERERLDGLEMKSQRKAKVQQDYYHDGHDETHLRDSLIVRYLSASATGGRGQTSHMLKRAVKAIFADGSIESMRLYPQVFERETKERKNPSSGDTKSGTGVVGTKRKADEVDIDKDQYGDYIDDEEDEEDNEVGPASGTRGKFSGSLAAFADEDEDDGSQGAGVFSPGEQLRADLAEAMGGPEAMNLRLRLMALLSRTLASPSLTAHLPPLSDLYAIFSTSIRPLSLETFSLFISPTSVPPLHPAALNSLAQTLLHSLIHHSAPSPHSVALASSASRTYNHDTNDDEDGEGEDNAGEAEPEGSPDDLTQDLLEKCYLPFPANTSSVEDNAKVSILVETLFRLFATHVGCEIIGGERDPTGEREGGEQAPAASTRGRSSSRGRGRSRGRPPRAFAASSSSSSGSSSSRSGHGQRGGSGPTNSLREAIETGITARHDRTSMTDRRLKRGGARMQIEERGKLVLQQSAMRLTMMLEVVERRAKMAGQG